MKELPPSLAGWHDYPQFILCQGKMPVNPAGETINPHDSANWMGHEEACSYSELLNLGVGFVFTGFDPCWFIDVDHCIVDGKWNPIAEQLLQEFDGAAFEMSVSGTGYHLFGCGTVPDHGKRNKDLGIEFYTEGRFVLLTGNDARGNVWTDWSHKLPWLVENYFPPKDTQISENWRDTPVPEWNGITDDEALVAKLMSVTPKFGGRASVADLMAGKEDVLATNYPSETDTYNRSGADAALANHLAFWTGKNHARIWNIMYRSALVRSKWEKHKNYLAGTISNAVDGCQNVYNTQPPPGDPSQPAAGGNATVGSQFLSAPQLPDYFKGCCYITQMHGVLIPNGSILKPDQFKAVYGGYTFAMDAEAHRTTKNAWEAFIDNQAHHFPRVDGMTFLPQEESRKIVIEDGLRLINIYEPIQIDRIKGDITPFLTHLHKIFPIKSDRDVFMAYIAAVVQHQGTKFQWCPVVQGVEGNGKTLFNRCVAAAVGHRYCHFPNASDLSGGGLKFNGWVANKVFGAIEELFTKDRYELLETMKPVITNNRIEIQFKGKDQYTGRICINFVMNTNHKDAVKITVDQRRYWMHYSPQQREADINRDGMGGNYFRDLYRWLDGGGYAMVAEYLWTYQIPDELNPATSLQRAPASTSRGEAILATMGPVEQHIMEAVDEGRQGFRGGYISSFCLNELLKEIKSEKLSPQRRLSILQGLGYEWHPGLPKGRVDNPVMSEGTKPTLYYKGLVDASLFGQASLVKQDYEKKQGYGDPGLRSV